MASTKGLNYAKYNGAMWLHGDGGKLKCLEPSTILMRLVFTFNITDIKNELDIYTFSGLENKQATM